MKGLISNVRKQSPLILSIVGSIGVIATAVTAVKATPKALHVIQINKDIRRSKAETVDDIKQTKVDIIKLAGKYYIPSVAIGISTIACIMGSLALNRSQIKSVTSAYILLDQAYREYKNKVKELYGENADNSVKTEIIKDLYEDSGVLSREKALVFYEENYGKLFERTMTEVILAEYKLNRKFALDGEASINDFLDFLGLEPIYFGNCIGWLSNSNYDFYGHPWIEFKHELIVLDDGMECISINVDNIPSIYY